MDDRQVPDVAPPPAHAPEAPNGPDSPRDRRKGLTSLVAIVAVLVVGLIVVPTMLSGKDSATPIPEDRPSTSVTTAQPAEAPGEGNGQLPVDPDTTGTPPISGIPPSEDHVNSDRIALLFQTELDTVSTTYGIAYVAAGAFVVLDARGVSEPDLEIAQQFEHVSEFALLTAEGATWAVNANDRDSSYLVSNMYVVVEAERPGTIAVVDVEQNSIGILSSGLPIPGVDLPAGAEVIVVQGRGVLVLPPTGGTFELSGTASSLIRLNDARAVSASVGATAYVQCDDELRCDYFAVMTGSDDAWPLAVPAQSVLDISPTGAWVVARTPDGNRLVEVESGELLELAPGRIDAVAWAPDGKFVALGRGNRVELFIPGELRSVELVLGEPLRNGTLLVFAS